MIGRMKRWFYERGAAWRGWWVLRERRLRCRLTERFLPMWAKETLLAENEQLRRELERQRAAYISLCRYADGLEEGLRAVRGIRINVTIERKDGAGTGDRPGAG